ncbi:MAG TPA: Gfo/Idh/MocA family oxidoreductase [Armatimonadota bacterium]|nr:Gfo/Idh/MocA family oxidoreductase [Armatimonadota bacterium]
MHRGEELETSRRKFLAGSLAGMAAVGLPSWFAKSAEAAEKEHIAGSPKKIGPNDTIQLAVIGPGGSKGGYSMGLGDAKAAARHEGCKVVAACDVDAKHLDEAVKAFGPDCKGYRDFRELLERKDIDAVIIGTPDHWHTLISIAAMKSGKDVYCEKPLTLTIGEGKKLVRAWKETKRVFQVGSQQRSDAKFRLACELVLNERIGRIKKVETHLPIGGAGGPFEVQPVPPDLDWDMWLGPSFYTDYVPQRAHGNFRWWLEYSGGNLTDWGAHHNDIAQWGLGMDRSGPLQVEASGKAPNPCRNSYNVFPEFDIRYVYPGGVRLLCTTKGKNGVLFEGDEGWIFVSRGRLNASDQRLLDEPLPPNAIRLYDSNDHVGNFIDCIRSRKQAVCDPEIGHRSATVCHLANISLRLGGRRLEWDPKKEEFPNDPEANIFVSRPMRPPWKM